MADFEREQIERLIRNTVLANLAKRGLFYLPVAVSARHVHLAQNHLEALFGKNAPLTNYRSLAQPGQFASNETVEVVGPKGSFGKVRILGPVRGATQVEVSVSDSFVLGIKPVIRMSGNIAGTPGCILKGPAGQIEIAEGVIVAARHVHLSAEQAAAYGLKDGDTVAIKTPAPRAGVIGNIAVRCGEGHDLEVHLDTDEANGNGIFCGTILEAILPKDHTNHTNGILPIREVGEVSGLSSSALELVTEREVNKAWAAGEKKIFVAAKGFVSPAALDRAKVKGIEICRLQG